MIWPFKRKSKADAAIVVMGDAIAFAADKWLYFSNTLTFKEGVQLDERIAMFAVPVSQGLRNNFKALKDAPEPLLFMIAAKGIEKSGTHTRQEIEEALGAQLPEYTPATLSL